MEIKKIIVNAINHPISTSTHTFFPADVQEFTRNTMSKPASNRVKKEAMLEMREKHHMTNAEIAKACGVMHKTVINHIGKQDDTFTHLTLQKSGKIRSIKAEYKWEQEFAAKQEYLAEDPRSRVLECSMCGRKFLTKSYHVRFCDVCGKRRVRMISGGMTAEQIDEQIENRKKAQQIVSLIQKATEIAGTMTDQSNILFFPSGEDMQ